MIHDLPNLLKENISHGSRDYPIEYYICYVPQTFRDLPSHWHDEMEITWIRSGSVRYVIGNEVYTAGKDSLLFIAPNLLHSASQITETTCETRSIVFHLNLLGLDDTDRCARKYIRPLQEGEAAPPRLLTPDEDGYSELLDCFQKLWQLQNKKAGEELLVKSLLYQLLYQLYKLPSQNAPAKAAEDSLKNTEKIKAVLTHIHEHYAEPMDIEHLAALCGFSQVHFMNIFKKATGTSCMDYIINYRIGMASMALKESYTPIIDIAMNNGFQNISYFNRAFHKRMGMTPSAFRKQFRV